MMGMMCCHVGCLMQRADHSFCFASFALKVDLRRLSPGQLVWRTKDAALDARLKGSFEGLAAADLRRVPVSVRVAGSLGQPLRLVLRCVGSERALYYRGGDRVLRMHAAAGRSESRPTLACPRLNGMGTNRMEADRMVVLQGPGGPGGGGADGAGAQCSGQAPHGG